LVAGCSIAPVQARQPEPAATAAAPAPQLPDIIRRYQSDERDVGRFWRVAWSEARRNRLATFYQESLSRLEAIDYEALAVPDRVDYQLLRTHIRWEARGLELEEKRLKEIDDVMPFRAAIQDLELARRRMEPCDPKAAAGVLDSAADQAKKIR